VDLGSGTGRRRLRDHASVKADPGWNAMVLGQPVVVQPQPDVAAMPFRSGVDGIAISADGSRLFYCPLSSHHLYSIATDLLVDQTRSDAEIGASVQDETRTFASDGLYQDAAGAIYLTDWEHNAVWRRNGANDFTMIAQDTSRLWWPDTLGLGADGMMYVTANQLHRQPRFNKGMDLRQKPYYLFKFPTSGRPLGTSTP
jgi:sugar lactone lactonase YvrE